MLIRISKMGEGLSYEPPNCFVRESILFCGKIVDGVLKSKTGQKASAQPHYAAGNLSCRWTNIGGKAICVQSHVWGRTVGKLRTIGIFFPLFVHYIMEEW